MFPPQDTGFWISIPFNIQHGLSLMVDITKRIVIGGYSAYQWTWLVVMALAGVKIIQFLLRRIGGIAGVDLRFSDESPSVFDNVGDGEGEYNRPLTNYERLMK